MNNLVLADQSIHHRDVVAARLNVLPGLGQFYKGHYLEGACVALGAAILAGWAGTLTCLAYAVGLYGARFGFTVDWAPLLLNPVTIGLGVLPLVLFWALAILEAYDEADLRRNVEGTAATPD